MLFAVLCRQSNPTNREIFLAIARRVELMYTVRVSAAQRVDWLTWPAGRSARRRLGHGRTVFGGSGAGGSRPYPVTHTDHRRSSCCSCFDRLRHELGSRVHAGSSRTARRCRGPKSDCLQRAPRKTVWHKRRRKMFASGCGADTRRQIGRVGIFEQITECAGFHRLDDPCIVVAGGRLHGPRIGHAVVHQRGCLTPSRLGMSMSLARDRACGLSPDERLHARPQLRQ